jgi:hypothetical protein
LGSLNPNVTTYLQLVNYLAADLSEDGTTVTLPAEPHEGYYNFLINKHVLVRKPPRPCKHIKSISCPLLSMFRKPVSFLESLSLVMLVWVSCMYLTFTPLKLQIDDELMQVTAVTATTLTVSASKALNRLSICLCLPCTLLRLQTELREAKVVCTLLDFQYC